jgi:hypothetical protein
MKGKISLPSTQKNDAFKTALRLGNFIALVSSQKPDSP